MNLTLTNTITTPATPTATDNDLAVLGKLINQLTKKRASNAKKQSYYDQKELLKDLKISLPPQMRTMTSVLGWPAKAVDVLADRIQLQGFKTPRNQDTELDEIALANDFVNEFTQAVTSALTHSVAFISTSRGDTAAGEPEVLWLARSAQYATGIWNRRTRTLDAGLTVNEEKNGKITACTLWLPDKIIDFTFHPGDKITADHMPNPTGRVLLEPLVYGADLGRPFGRSRITPAVRSLTDSAIRTIVRSEVGAEFYASPQRYVLGAEPEAFQDKWSAVVSRVLTISKDEDGQLPQIGQFTQLSMQPHIDQLRQWASLMASESSIPLDELGFPSDNPASDAAIQSQRDPLRQRADSAIRGFQRTLRRLAVNSIAVKHNTPVGDVSDVIKQTTGWFAPTIHITDAAAADAVLKQVSVMPWLAESTVILEKLGYNADAISRLTADKALAEGKNLLERIAQSPPVG